MPEELLKALAHPVNQAMLNLLTVEPTYPRKIADLLALPETEVARRLKQLETLGLVASQWTYIGKNVKLYRLVARRIAVEFASEGLRVDVVGTAGQAPTPTAVLNPFVVSIPAPPEFVGRDAELRILEGSEPVVLVEGMPGIGKTSLVSLFAHRMATQRPVFWHSFRGVESLNWLANRVGVFLAQQGNTKLLEAVQRGADVADKRELLLSGLDDPRFTVVLDDAHQIEDEAVRSLLADAIQRVRKGRLVVAGREPSRAGLAPGSVRIVRLEGLIDEDVLRFLELKDMKVPRALLPRIRDEVGGHPLALNLLVETAKQRAVPIETLLDRIPERDLEEYLLHEIYATLGEDERLLLTVASLFRTAFDLDDLSALVGKNLEGALVKLRRRLLVTPVARGFGLHEIIRNFFYTLLQDKARLHMKAAGHYLAKGSVEGRFEAMHHYLAAGRRDLVLDLLRDNLDLKEFDFVDAGYQNLYLTILNLFPRSEVSDPRRWALIADEKGDIHFHRGDFAAALQHYDEAGAHFSKEKNADRLADLAWKRAMALDRLGRREDAAGTVTAALAAAGADDVTRKRLEELRATLVSPAGKKKAAAR